MKHQGLKYYFGMAAVMGALSLGAQAAPVENVTAAAGQSSAKKLCADLFSAYMRNAQSNTHVITLRWTNDKNQLSRESGPAMVKCNARTGGVVTEIWAIDGNLHNLSSPAYREYDQETQNLRVEGWWKNGKQTRDEGPVFTIHDPTTQIVTTEEWRKDDHYFRSSGEATNLRRDPISGIVILEEWAEGRQGEDLHRIGGPAFMQRDPVTGIVIYEEWRQQDKFYRENDLPTKIWRNKLNGNVIREEWKSGYILDRNVGPAVIQYSPDGQTVLETEYWKKGKRIQISIENSP